MAKKTYARETSNINTGPIEQGPKVPVAKEEMLFDKKNFIVMAIGVAVMVLGYILMSGGAMPDENTWDTSRIYSPMRITVAPIMVITGLCIMVYGIFRK